VTSFYSAAVVFCRDGQLGINNVPITATHRAFFICVYMSDAAHSTCMSHVEVIDIKLTHVPLQRQSNVMKLLINEKMKCLNSKKIKNYGSKSSSMEKCKQEAEALKIVEAKALRLWKRIQEAEARPVIWKRKQ